MPTKIYFKDVFNRLMVGWIVDFGSISAFAACGWFVPEKWVPFFGFSMLLIIWMYGNGNLMRHRHNCSLLNYYSVYIVFACSTAMLVVNLMHTRWFGGAGGPVKLNQEGPFISSLWVMTLAAVFYGLAKLRRTRPAYCVACKAQDDLSVRHALESNVFHSEVIFQLKLLFWLCLTVSVIGWVYYVNFYINVNINVPDVFFYYIIPLVVFLLSVIYLGARYSGMHYEATITQGHKEEGASTHVRFMIVRGEEILLSEVARDQAANLGMWDTPAVTSLPLTEHVSLKDAHDMFAGLSGCDRFEVRQLFSTTHGVSNVLHYAAFLADDDTEMPNLHGTWFNIYEIDMMMKSGVVARPFAYEMHRVYTMTLAWKTYDINGKRLYPIKNYRPTFRLSDFKHWDVDYNDLQWLNIAKYNEDKPFFRIRKFWRTYITGADLIWRRSR